MDILEKLAGNKTIKNLAFGRIKKYIKEENISMIVIFVDTKGEIMAKEYNEPMAILPQTAYATLLSKTSKPADNGNDE